MILANIIPHSGFVILLHSIFPRYFHWHGTSRQGSLPTQVSRDHPHSSSGTNAPHFSVLPLQLLCLQWPLSLIPLRFINKVDYNRHKTILRMHWNITDKSIKYSVVAFHRCRDLQHLFLSWLQICLLYLPLICAYTPSFTQSVIFCLRHSFS